MSDISTYYGGSVLGLRGNDSIIIISDLRLGQSHITVNKEYKRVSLLSNSTLIGLANFVPDCQILLKKIQKNVNLFKLYEESEINIKEATSLVSYILYSNRFRPYFVEPILGGFNGDETFISVMDTIGCVSYCNFAAVGTASKKLYGLCEALYKENLDYESLFTIASQIFLNSVDRDALSGWNADCYILTKNNLIVRRLDGRMD